MSALVWLLAGILLVIAEVVVGDLVLLMLAGGAFAAAGTEIGLDPPLWVDFVVFSVVSVLLLGVLRPVVRRHMLSGPPVLMNTDALTGREATVLERVDDSDGRVKIGGEVWSARTVHPHDVFDVGTHVMVIEIDGATAVVTRV